MTQKEKLIEILDYLLPGEHDVVCDMATLLIHRGVVVLPCKVGDTVFQHDSERIYESRVRDIIFDTPTIAFNTEAVGKTVFLTREEAEAALKGAET